MRPALSRPLALLPMLLAAPLAAQPATHCAPPERIDPPRPVAASAEDPVRRGPIAGYTLALGWTPEYCHAVARRGARARTGDGFQCGGAFAGRFVLHGLWPDGPQAGRWPQYCRPVGLLPPAILRENLCATPSAQLLQHEWAKHGSCMAATPEAYFAAARRAYALVRVPDMRALAARRDLRVADLRRAFAAANPAMPPDAFRIGANRRGWLEEVRVCLGRDLRPRGCAADAQAAAPGSRLRIETGARRAPRSSPYRDGADRDGGG